MPRNINRIRTKRHEGPQPSLDDTHFIIVFVAFFFSFWSLRYANWSLFGDYLVIDSLLLLLLFSHDITFPAISPFS